MLIAKTVIDFFTQTYVTLSSILPSTDASLLRIRIDVRKLYYPTSIVVKSVADKKHLVVKTVLDPKDMTLSVDRLA